MTLDWTRSYQDIGNNFGYSTHQKMLCQALKAAGVRIDSRARVAVHITTPWHFEPDPAKFNVLYTMYEGENIPDAWPEPMNKADLIVVPSSHSKEVLGRYTDLPIEVCLEGVDPRLYKYHVREHPRDRMFTFLWIGATNPRKGIAHIKVAWEYWYKLHPEVARKTQLIMKTTVAGCRQEVVQAPDNVYIDTRVLPLRKDPKSDWPSLPELYWFAHAFLWPTMGEGFGLPLAEAMSTGLPCIYTPYSGPNDFLSEREGYPVRFKMDDVVINETNIGCIHKTRMANPDTGSIIERMLEIYTDYEAALERGLRAAERVRRELTWDISARRFMEIIEQYTGPKARMIA